MSTLSTILAIILTPTLVVAGIVYVLRKFFAQLLSRDIENHKARLQAEVEQSKLRLENDLQSKLFEFQTKFSLYHQQRAEVIRELYEMLSETELVVSVLVHPMQSADGKTQKEKIDEAYQKKVDLARFFSRRRIYLDEDLCQKMDSLIMALQKAVVRFEVSQNDSEKYGADLKMWQQAWLVMEDEVPPIKKALEVQFRKILSATTSETSAGASQ